MRFIVLIGGMIQAWVCSPVCAADVSAPSPGQTDSKPRLVSQGLAGYVSMDVPAPLDEFGYGVSLYSTGTIFTRIPRLQFPADEQGRTILIHNLTHYSKDALYRSVEAWLAGSDPAAGKFDEEAAITTPCKARPLSIRQGSEKLPIQGCDNWLQRRLCR